MWHLITMISLIVGIPLVVYMVYTQDSGFDKYVKMEEERHRVNIANLRKNRED